MKYTTAVKHWHGNASAMARDLGLPTSTVLSWQCMGYIPALRQLHIQHITDGALRADADVFAPGAERRKR